MPTPVAPRTPIQTAARWFGVLFLAIGVLGFVPGLTAHVDQLGIEDRHSQAELLGIFSVSVVVNGVHVLFGVAGLKMADTSGSARVFTIAGGLILLTCLSASSIGHASAMKFFTMNVAGTLLHLALGAAMITSGVLLTRTHKATDSSTGARPATPDQRPR